MTRYLRPLILVTVLAMGLAACGGDDLGTDLGDGLGTAPSGDNGVGDATLPTSVGNIPGLSGECEAYANLSLAMTSVFSGGFDGFDTSDLVSRLPAEGRADGAIIVDALQQFTDGLAAAGIDLSQGMASLTQEQLQVFGDLSDSVFTDEVNDAFDRLGTLVEGECSVGS